VDDVTHAFGASDRGERARQPRDAVRDLDEFRITQEPPELAKEKRYAVRDRMDSGCQSRDRTDVVGVGQMSYQLRHVFMA